MNSLNFLKSRGQGMAVRIAIGRDSQLLLLHVRVGWRVTLAVPYCLVLPCTALYRVGEPGYEERDTGALSLSLLRLSMNVKALEAANKTKKKLIHK